MNHDPAALIEKRPEHAVSDKKNKGFETAMVSVGSLVAFLSAAAVKKTAVLLKKAAVKTVSGIVPFGRRLKAFAAKRINRSIRSVTGIGKKISEFKKNFSERKAEAGFLKAFRLCLSDISFSTKGGKKLAATVINYAVPVACVAFLVCVVSDKVSADYGVSVEYNGQEIGVVSEESVLNSAQEVIEERAAYFDTNSDTYITATLSLKPLGSEDEIVNEQVLADAIQEQINIGIPEGESTPEAADAPETSDTAGNTEASQTVDANVPEQTEAGAVTEAQQTESADKTETAVSENNTENTDNSAVDEAIGRTSENDDRERAFVVSVDGVTIGAVKENEAIGEFLEEMKDEYLEEDVVDVSFDRNIEYTYEQFVDPDEIVDEQDIIDKLGSNVMEPVYYEVQQGDNPWNIARANGMTTEELNSCNITFDGEQIDDITQYCPVGAVVQLSEEVPYLQVLTTKEVEYTESIDYETVTTEDPDMYMGDYVVEAEGIEGEKKVKAMVTYRGDVKVSSEIIDEAVISEPVTQYLRVGTRETTTPVSTGTGGSGQYFWPLDGGYISAYQGDGRGHKGIDIAAPYGTPIYAAESGTVIETGGGWNGGYGNCVRVQHDDGNVTVYAHQSSIAVSYGDYVVKGQLLGYVGSTGDSTGNHLHFEVRSYGTYANPLDYVSQD